MKKKIIFDMSLNIIASAIPIAVLQLWILPGIAGNMTDERYGLVVTLLSLFSMVPASLGNCLNNIRLLHDGNYQENSYEGDFNVLLIIFSFVNLLIVGAVSYFYEQTVGFVSLVLTVLVSLVWLATGYFSVTFRLKIDYVAILINSILQTVGYGLGYLVYQQVGHWQLVYLAGYSVSLLYILLHSDLWKEKLVVTPLFKKTAGQSVLLLISGLLGNFINYADRLLIYPLLGGTLVSVYYVATLFGKIVSMAITPINSVALTYLAKVKQKKDTMFHSAVLLGTGVCAIGFVCCILLSRPILSWLYPQYVEEAMRYIYLTTANMAIATLISIVNPFILKFFDMKWQIVISGGTAVVYVVLSMSFLYFYGLYGFCFGTLLTNVLKLAFVLLVYQKCTALVPE